MPRKPLTNPLPSAETSPEPARPLGPDGRALWDRLHAAHNITDAPMLEQVLQVCQAVDLAESADDPRSELAARNFVCKVLKNLFPRDDENRRRTGRPPVRTISPFLQRGPYDE